MTGLLSQLATQLGLTECDRMPLLRLQAWLRTIWANYRYLIIVDNLDAMTDADELLTTLHALAGQSRFLLTNRYTLRSYPFIQTFWVPELSRADSLALMRYEVQRKQGRCTLSDLTLTQIYAIIGGVPLAIRLVTDQIGRLSLAAVLDGLRQAHAPLPESMYGYIYWCTWQRLCYAARHVLFALLLIDPAGEDPAWIVHRSACTEYEVQAVLAELVDYSLVEVCGETERPRYKLHSLTRTFCRPQCWPNGKRRKRRKTLLT